MIPGKPPSTTIIFIKQNRLTIAFVVVVVFAFLWLRGCIGSKWDSSNHDVKNYKDSVEQLKKDQKEFERKYQLDSTKLTNEKNLARHEADSFNAERIKVIALLNVQKKQALPLIQQVLHDTINNQCDSLALAFEKYIWNQQLEKDLCDSTIAAKDWQIAMTDSLTEIMAALAAHYRSLFYTATEFFGLTYQAYEKEKPRNQVSVVAAGQLYQPSAQIAIGGGLNFRNKRGYSLSGLAMVSSGGTIYQLQISKPISFRKK